MKTSALVAAAAMLAWLAPACAESKNLQVIDDSGRSVELTRAANRIVTLSPHLTDLVLAIDAGHLLVGVSSADDLPSAFGHVPRLGGAGGLDREALLRAAPELVLAWRSGNRTTDIEWLKTLGVPVFISEPTDLGDIADTMRAIGILVGRQAAGEAAASDFAASTEGGCQFDNLLPAVIVVWDRPLLSIGGHHWINSALQTAGYRNHFAGVQRGVFALSPESRLSLDGLAQIRLISDGSGSDDDRLAQTLSRPGSELVTAIRLLCKRRLSAAQQPLPSALNPVSD